MGVDRQAWLSPLGHMTQPATPHQKAIPSLPSTLFSGASQRCVNFPS